nr:hypothetical protein BaRGS_009199 [Batillaria attramentaria]
MRVIHVSVRVGFSSRRFEPIHEIGLALSDAGFNVSHLLSRIYTFFYLFDHALGNFWKMAILILVIFGVSIGGKMIGSFKYMVVETRDPSTNLTYFRITTTDFYLSNRRLFHDIFDITFNTVISTMVQTVNDTGVLPVLVLCGVTMNVLNMAVFFRQGLRDRVNLCLFSLAVSDTGFNVSYLASKIHAFFYHFNYSLGNMAKWHVFMGLYNAFLSLSTCLTVIISLERCVCVINPLKAKRLLSSSACTIPSVVQAIVRSFVPEFGRGHRYGNSYSVSIVVTHLLEAVNCSVNFIVYYTMSTRFRQTLRELFRGGRAKHDGKESETRVSVMSASDDAYQMKQQY